jgi:prophage regulatory protein
MEITQAPQSLLSDPNRLLRIDDVVALTTLSKSCVSLWAAQGRFPRPVSLSTTLKVWRARDIGEWIDRHFSRAGNIDHA